MAGGEQQRSLKRRRHLSRPRQLIGFSPFARTLLFSRSCTQSLAIDPSLASTSSHEDGISHEEKTKFVRKVESLASYDDDDDIDEEEQEVETVQVDFEFFDPRPEDFHGIKILLRSFLDDKEWDLSGLVDLILEQTTVGTVVKAADQEEEEEEDGANDENGDDDGPFAVISALNLGRYAANRCIKEVKEFLYHKCSDGSATKRLKSYLEDQASSVGLLISQRYANCPHQLVPPLYDALFDEASWATEDEPTQELQDSFRFKYYLLVTRIFEKKNANQSKSKLGNDDDEPVIYVKAEDEIFHKISELSFTFHLHAEQLAPRELKSYKEVGLVMVIKADKIPKFRKELKALLADS